MTALSFNDTDYIAVGYDKKSDYDCLHLWNLETVMSAQHHGHVSSRSSQKPIVSLCPSEGIASLTFAPNATDILLVGTSNSGLLKEYDTRAATTATPNFQIQHKCVYGITFDPFNPHYFSSHSAANPGMIAFWDRRYIRAGNRDSLLLLNPVGDTRSNSHFPMLRLSHTRRGEFALLQQHTDRVKRWQTDIQTANGKNHVFVSSVTEAPTLQDRVVSFDYITDLENPLSINFLCVRQSGEIFRMKVTESTKAVKFDPTNVIASADPDGITFVIPNTEQALMIPIQTKLEAFVLGEDNKSQPPQKSVLLNPSAILDNDISALMRRLAIEGYGLNPLRNVKLFHPDRNTMLHPKARELYYIWQWIHLAKRSAQRGSMISGDLDLSFEGIWGLWRGYSGHVEKQRVLGASETNIMSEYDYAMLLQNLSSRKSIHTVYFSKSKTRRALRQLCLKVAGWSFEISELEEKLQALETNHEYEKAAGWAVFHGNIERAVEALSRSNSSQLLLMATALASYLNRPAGSATAVTIMNSNGFKAEEWRSLCTSLAADVSNAYMKAVFMHVSEGVWDKVLASQFLPLNERLGIALRFLDDASLTTYIDNLANDYIRRGDLEGILLTGITPDGLSLLQNYIDQTCDVQTTAAIIAQVPPTGYYNAELSHVDEWIESYRILLNSWKLFGQRSLFDVKRGKNMVERQVWLRCNHCKSLIDGKGNTKTSTKSGSVIKKQSRQQLQPPQSINGPATELRCKSCNHPLPRCTICQISLGVFPRTSPVAATINSSDSITPTITSLTAGSAAAAAVARDSNFARWFTFCLSCNHGMHAYHLQDWFITHSRCPVPDCNCLCGKSFD